MVRISGTSGGCPQKSQQRVARSKVSIGCDNCKRRRIRCDEKRPACANCLRAEQICSGYGPLPGAPPLGKPASETIIVAAETLEDTAKGPPVASREIDNWRYALSHDDHSEPEPSSSRHQEQQGLASRLSAAASELFRQLLAESRPQTPKSMLRELEREYGCLQLWCDGYGLGSGDLDVVLAESRRLRRLTVRLLVSICHTLADKLTPVLVLWLDGPSYNRLEQQAARTRDLAEAATLAIRDADHAESDSDDSDDSNSEISSESIPGLHPIEDIIEDLETDIQCLADLGPRFKEPVRDIPEEEEAAVPAQVTGWDPAEYLSARLRQRYPKADLAFARLLGQANWDRALRLYATREKNAQSLQRPVAEAESASRPPGTVIESAFHDSGLGTSIHTTSYAETVLSYHGTNGSSIKIPPIPAEGRQGKSFECPICGCTCQLRPARWKRLWKWHVLSDLQPYVCIMDSCSLSRVPFLDKVAWMQHLELEHNFEQEITCPLCQEHLSGGPLGKAFHLARHLEEISLMILPANAESEADGAGHDNDDELIMSSDVPPPLPAPELSSPLGPSFASDDSDNGTDRETSRPNTTWPTYEQTISQAEPIGTVGYGCSECGKAFARSYDLDNHAKIHGHRPYKCCEPGCRYNTLGWPTAKELERHELERHRQYDSDLPRTFTCLFKPCPYMSTRESNWKQHMEKAHGCVDYGGRTELEEALAGLQRMIKQDEFRELAELRFDLEELEERIRQARTGTSSPKIRSHARTTSLLPKGGKAPNILDDLSANLPHVGSLSRIPVDNPVRSDRHGFAFEGDNALDPTARDDGPRSSWASGSAEEDDAEAMAHRKGRVNVANPLVPDRSLETEGPVIRLDIGGVLRRRHAA